MEKKINFNNAIKCIIIFSILFIIVSLWFVSGTSDKIDTTIYNSLCSIRNDNLTKIMIFISELATIKIVIIISILLLIIPIKKRRYGLDIVIITASQYIFNSFVKIIFKRPRMQEFILVYEKSFSFPSGHTITATVMYSFLIYLAYTYIENTKLKTFIIICLIFVIILVAFSRMYLGAHYFTDVMAAIFLGISFIISAILLNIKIREKINK